jgi:LysM repeat protein
MHTFIRTGFILLVLLLWVSPAWAFKDSDARGEIDKLRIRLDEMGSSLQVRQMGLGEQIQSLREDLARVESKVDENRRDARIVGQQLDVAKIETRENLVQLNHDYQKRFETVDSNITRLARGIEDLQKNIGILSANIRTMSEFEEKQEKRITQMHGQLQQLLEQKLNAIVEEVGRENLRLQNEMAAMNRDIVQFQNLINKVNGEVRGLAGQVGDLARRQESMAGARSAAGSGGEHIVQKGETLSLIAQRYGVTVEAVKASNGLSNANLIQVGQALVIPGR